MKLLISAAALLQSTMQQTINHGPDETNEWTYNLHGSDWSTKVWENSDGDDVNECGDGPQAPIDLTTYGSDGFASTYDPLLESAADKFTFDLKNLITMVGWDYSKAAYGFSWPSASVGCYGWANADCQPDSAQGTGPVLEGGDAGEGAGDAEEGDEDGEADGGGRRRLAVGASDGDASVMMSTLAETAFQTTQEFKTVSVEFHVGSEHTFDGKERFDLEM